MRMSRQEIRAYLDRMDEAAPTPPLTEAEERLALVGLEEMRLQMRASRLGPAGEQMLAALVAIRDRGVVAAANGDAYETIELVEGVLRAIDEAERPFALPHWVAQA